MYRIISLYTGAGGLDLGFEAAGFDTSVALEMDIDAVATLRANRDWPVIGEDIHSVPTKQLLEAGGLKEGEADLLIGGPPCQPFSKSGYWARGDARRLEDPRATTLEAYLRVLRDAKPQAFLLENVPGLAYNRKSEGIEMLQRTIDAINAEHGTRYSFNVGLLRATEYGVPQDRQRVFITGHRDGLSFDFPSPTHSPTGENGTEPFRTAWDAIGDLQDDDHPELKMGGKWADLLPTIPEGKNYLHHTDRGEGFPLFGWRTRYWSFLLKLAKNLPSWTITADPGSAIGPFHWKSRRLSTAELKRLQTFPDDYAIVGSRRSVQRQLGNAVPSALSERLGYEIRAQFFGESKLRPQPLTLLPPRMAAIPEPESVPGELPLKYRKLVGDHDEHPGTGKGPGAQAREHEGS